MAESGKKIVQLNQIIGCHLVNFLEGIDAANFLETVNNSDQFNSIATTSDLVFRRLLNEIFRQSQRVDLPRMLYECYLEDCEIIDGKLVWSENENSSLIQPRQRLFIHSCFTINGFGLLCRAYRTSLFRCYSRLLPFNTDLYYADFGLLDYELYNRTITLERDLNDYEQKLFKINTYFNTPDSEFRRTNMKFVKTLNEFQRNFAIRFSSSEWLEAIGFSKFMIVGGCVINALCDIPFPDTKQQDVNFIYPTYCGANFEADMKVTINQLKNMSSKYSTHEIKVEKVPGSSHYHVFLPCGIKLDFVNTSIHRSEDSISHIMHNFDMDISQIAYTGNKIICTFPFMQALGTKCFITYSLHGETTKNVCTRIAKYCARGFYLLEPINFDGSFDMLMKQNEIPLYRCEHREFIDDEGEVQIATIEYWRRLERNIDTFQLQESFIAAVYP